MAQEKFAGQTAWRPKGTTRRLVSEGFVRFARGSLDSYVWNMLNLRKYCTPIRCFFMSRRLGVFIFRPFWPAVCVWLCMCMYACMQAYIHTWVYTKAHMVILDPLSLSLSIESIYIRTISQYCSIWLYILNMYSTLDILCASYVSIVYTCINAWMHACECVCKIY